MVFGPKSGYLHLMFNIKTGEKHKHAMALLMMGLSPPRDAPTESSADVELVPGRAATEHKSRDALKEKAGRDDSKLLSVQDF